MTQYYFAIASQQFLLSQEPTEEILRERMNYYHNIKKPIDFWIIKKTELLNNSEISRINQYLKIPTVAIISTDNLFIIWLKLRLNFVITGTFKINITT